MKTLLGFSASLIISAMACAPPPPQAPAIDLEAERNSLMEANRAWYEAWSQKGVDGFVEFFTDDGSFLPVDMPIATGKENIRATTSQIASLPGFAVEWSANRAEVSASADLGYTIGTYELTANDPNGNPMVSKGKYVAVWRKQGSSWKVVADIFNPDAPPSGGG